MLFSNSRIRMFLDGDRLHTCCWNWISFSVRAIVISLRNFSLPVVTIKSLPFGCFFRMMKPWGLTYARSVPNARAAGSSATGSGCATRRWWPDPLLLVQRRKKGWKILLEWLTCHEYSIRHLLGVDWACQPTSWVNTARQTWRWWPNTRATHPSGVCRRMKKEKETSRFFFRYKNPIVVQHIVTIIPKTK